MQRLMSLLSLPGFNAFGWEQTAEAIMGLLDGLHVENALLVGYSLGARLALYLAEKHGHRFQTVVSISGSTGLSGETVLGLSGVIVQQAFASVAATFWHLLFSIRFLASCNQSAAITCHALFLGFCTANPAIRIQGPSACLTVYMLVLVNLQLNLHV